MADSVRQVITMAGKNMLASAQRALDNSKKVTFVLTTGEHSVSAFKRADGSSLVQATLANGEGEILFDAAFLVATLLIEDDGY